MSNLKSSVAKTALKFKIYDPTFKIICEFYFSNKKLNLSAMNALIAFYLNLTILKFCGC